MRTDDPTDPINALYAEHDAALQALSRLDDAAGALARGEASPEVVARFDESLGFLETEVRAHNEWEETHLFPSLELTMGPNGPTGCMRDEHQALWGRYHRLEPLRLAMRKGSASASDRAEAARIASEIVDLLRAHIEKENEVLFPMARRMLRPADFVRMREARGGTTVEG